MIRFADENTKAVVKSMWKTVFGDKDEYIDLIFSRKYENHNTLVYFDQGVAAASLQMFPYTIRFYGADIPFYYLAGLCTLPQYRNRGFMGKLILESFAIMRRRGIPLSILVPAEEWLFGYYAKYGYAQTFDKGNEALDLKSICEDYHSNPELAFAKFDSQYQQQDFCVLKTAGDLETIVDDYLLDGRPDKYNLAAMSRIIDPVFLLKKYAEKNPHKNFSLLLTDSLIKQNIIYKIHRGKVSLRDDKNYDFASDEKQLIQLLFGYKTEAVSSGFGPYFTTHSPIINLMLE